jgi:non-specific serine/threonine protein kinase
VVEGRVSPFGEQLRRLREAAGITQEELAERAGLSRDAIGALERGLRRHPHPLTVRALAAGLGLSDQDLAVLRATLPQRSVSPLSSATRARFAPPPVPLTSLVGRQRELDELRHLLTVEEVRLVTLTGPGGVGKTRLAIEVATSLEPAYPGGVAFVPLAPVQDTALVLPTIAAAVGVREATSSPDGRAGQPSLVERLAHSLHGRRVLLVLDNMEHLVEAGAPVAALLVAAPELTVLVTSQATLWLSGEHEYPVRPLSLGRRDDRTMGRWESNDDPTVSSSPRLLVSEAVRLFVERARAVRPDFALTAENATTVEEICRRLDGLPLALELAAARVNVLSPEELLARLGSGLAVLDGGRPDQPPRLRSLRDAVAWSYGLLDPAEQTLFRRLAVFADGFTLEAAEAVVEGAVELPTASVFDGIASLVDKSLLRRESSTGSESRFGMLSAIQEFGLDRLASEREEAATRRAHAATCLDLAESAWPAFRHRIGQDSSLRRLEEERGNLRAALAWLNEHGDAASLLQLSGALFWFWYVRGPLSEGRFWLERALSAEDTGVPPETRVRAMIGAAMLAHFQGDDEAAERWLETSLAVCATLEDPWWRAMSLLLIGIVAEDRGDYDAAAPRFIDALALFRIVNDPAHTALALNHLGIASWGQGQVDRAASLCAEAVELQRAAGDRWGLANCLAYLGLLAGERGEHERAATAHQESLELRWATHAWEGIAGSLANLATVAAAVDRPKQAARLLGAAAALLEEAGRVEKLPERAVHQRAAARSRAILGPAAFAAAEAAGRALPREQAVAEAIALADQLTGSPAIQPADDISEAPASLCPPELTEREVEVLRLVATGLSNAEVAERLAISPRTVGTHLQRIYGKLGVTTRSAATNVAIRSGLT